MASLEEADLAVATLAVKLGHIDPELRARHLVDRTVSCHLVDLDVVYSARVSADGVSELTRHPREPAQIKLSVGSDDLVALTEGRLGVGTAWAAGRLKVDAGVLDLLKLRALL